MRPYKNLTYVKDLFYFDGPLISLFKSEEKNIVFHWCDCTNECHKWIVFEATERQIKEYNENKSFKKVIENAKELFLAEVVASDVKNAIYTKVSLEAVKKYIME